MPSTHRSLFTVAALSRRAYKLGRDNSAAHPALRAALVFTPPKERPTREDITLWWTWTAGADWRHPEGLASSIAGREQHPVVPVAYEDAVAYAPPSPARSFNPSEPHAQQHVTKGGSFLCAENDCVNYRPSARRGAHDDTGMSHLGFRCVLAPDHRDSITREPTANKPTKPNP